MQSAGTILSKDCGCYDLIRHNGVMTQTSHHFCKMHTEENKQARIAKAKAYKLQMLNRLDDADEIRCNLCNRFICYVSAGDLEGSYFFCSNCKNT